jgi:hypothetical protein
MLEKISNNMKIIIGVSSIIIIGLIYSFIKKFNKPTIEQQNIPKRQIIEGYKKIIKGNETIDFTPVISKLDELLESINTLNRHGEDHKNAYIDNLKQTLIPSKINTHTVLFNSKFSTKNGNIYSFNLNSVDNIFSPYRNVINYRVMNVIMPYHPHNIYNRSKSFLIDDVTITIDDGYYTINQLLSTINTKPEISSRNLKFIFNSITYKIDIVNTSSSSYTLENINNNTLLSRLGLLSDNTSINIKDNDTTSGQNIPDLSLHYVNILIDRTTKGSDIDNNNDNILATIPMRGSHGDIIYYRSSAIDYLSKLNFDPNSDTSYVPDLTFTLQRSDGTIYDLGGLNFTIRLEFTVGVNITEDS